MPRSRNLHSMPSSAWQVLLGVTANRKPYLDEGERFPDLRLRVQHVATEKDRLDRYRRACRFENRDYLPVTYPQIMAMPLHTALVAHHNLDLHVEHVTRLGLPLDIQPFVRVGAKRTDRRAVVGMDDEAPVLVDEAENRIARNGMTALRQLDCDPFGAADADGVRMGRLARRWLPLPKTRHPYRDRRFAAITRGRSPVR